MGQEKIFFGSESGLWGRDQQPRVQMPFAKRKLLRG